ncbi:MAG: hypothetical protein UY80_C0036G0002 [Parcubacteria group bacterium GW2011_GWB1_53_43]|nr:MAG: hypothetical protein UY80_C0036G0002 [Parcubacteria group bacterium GW2011_GWB1_53_43]
MERLSLTSYVWKCILGAEVIYTLCLIGRGFLWLLYGLDA